MDLRKYLFLFDIDGTILDIKGDGKKALLTAVEFALGKKITEEISLAGGIDNVFFRHYYRLFNMPEDQYDHFMGIFKNKYIELMNGYDKADWRIFPNSYETISFLAGSSNIGLTTGNMVSGAMIKLRRFGLDKYFQAGGFGDKADSRTEMVKDAIFSCESFYNKTFDKKNIYLFGDTQKDIHSAIENGIIPVHIDPENKNRELAFEWGAEYYGNFVYMKNFFQSIEKNGPIKNNSQRTKDNLIYFDK